MLQLAIGQKASAAQTAALIDQENTAEMLSENLVSTQEELRNAHRTIADLKMRLEVAPGSHPAQHEHACTDSIDTLREKACDSELLEFTDIKTELSRIDDQLGALGSENASLRTSRLLTPQYSDMPCCACADAIAVVASGTLHLTVQISH